MPSNHFSTITPVPGPDPGIVAGIHVTAHSLLQGIWLGNFCGSRITEAIPAGLVELRQRVAANSLCLRGGEFVPRGSETFRGWQGIREAGQGIGE